MFRPGFGSPAEIQRFLDSIPYNAKEECKPPERVFTEKNAHCFEGALFAAACLRELGYPPLVVDLKAWNDDDHVIAVFRERGCWGAVVKLDFATLRFREPVYRNLRELAMSYFDFYFNTLGQKTLRAYSRPLKLERYDGCRWADGDDDLEYIADGFNQLPYYPLLGEEQIAGLSPVPDHLLQAGLAGSNPEGLYVPKE